MIRTPFLSQIAESYSGLGIRPAGIPALFGHYHCPHWRNQVMSPVWPTSPELSRGAVRGLERFFLRNPPRRSHDRFFSSYLNLLSGRGGHAIVDAKRILRDEGWTRFPQDSKLNVWEKPLSAPIPAGYSLRVGRLRSTPVHKDFIALTRRNFGSSAFFVKELEAMFSTIAKNTIEVVAYDRKNRPAAAGLVVTGKGAAFLFCGSVVPSHRGRGLWKALVGARQALSALDGARIWTTSTTNPRIAGKADRSLKILVYHKGPVLKR